jgi:hypothetical protein
VVWTKESTLDLKVGNQNLCICRHKLKVEIWKPQTFFFGFINGLITSMSYEVVME